MSEINVKLVRTKQLLRQIDYLINSNDIKHFSSYHFKHFKYNLREIYKIWGIMVVFNVECCDLERTKQLLKEIDYLINSGDIQHFRYCFSEICCIWEIGVKSKSDEWQQLQKSRKKELMAINEVIK
jgi:hypothetical protein